MVGYEIGKHDAVSETLTNGWVEFLAPSFGTLVVSSAREKVCDFVPLTSVLLYGMDKLDVLRVRPATYERAVSECRPTLI